MQSPCVNCVQRLIRRRSRFIGISRTDVLKYYFQITVIEIAWYLRYAVKNKTNLALIRDPI